MNISTKQERIIFGVLVFLSVLMLRLPWISSDPGIPSFWDFGYFVTDEGYYTGDGRLAYLTGDFFSTKGESMSFFKLPVSCVLTFWSYCIFGLKSWAPRIPQLLASLWSWSLIYYMGARRTRPWIAGTLVMLVAATPPFLAHERSFSNDFLMGTFTITSLWILYGQKGIGAGIAGAFLFSIAVLTKTSAIGLLPLVLFFSLFHHNHRWKRSVTFCLSVPGILLCVNLLMHHYVQQHANEAALTFKQALEMGYKVDPPPQMSFEKLESYFRSWSVFLRWPLIGRMSFFSLWMIAFPGMILISKIIRTPFRKWSRSELFSAGTLIYVALISIHGKNNVRYFLPVFLLTPLFLIESRRILSSEKLSSVFNRTFFSLLTILSAFLIFWKTPVGSATLQEVFYAQFSSPRTVLWALTYPMLLLYGVLGAICGYICSEQGKKIYFSVFGFLSAIWLAQLIQTGAVFFRTDISLPEALKPDYIKIQTLLIFQMFLLFSMIFWLPGKLRSYRIWYSGILGILLLTFVINPYWSNAVNELADSRKTLQNTQTELCKQIPGNSVIIGARAQSLFLETKCSLIPYLYMGAGEEKANFFWRQIAEWMRQDPKRPFFVLLEPQEPHSWSDLSKQKDVFSFHTISKVTLPSFADGSDGETYIAQLKRL